MEESCTCRGVSDVRGAAHVEENVPSQSIREPGEGLVAGMHTATA